MRKRPIERRWPCIGLALLMAGMTVPAEAARATVIEIADDGHLIVHDRTPRQTAALSPLPLGSQHAAGPPPALRPHFDAAADRYELSAELIEAVAWAESRFRQQAVSRAGARGVMQLMPATARDLAVDPRDPGANIRGGTAYLRMLLNRYAGDVVKTLAAYNAGPGAVDRYGGVPPFAETRTYVQTILGRLARRVSG